MCVFASLLFDLLFRASDGTFWVRDAAQSASWCVLLLNWRAPQTFGRAAGAGRP